MLVNQIPFFKCIVGGHYSAECQAGKQIQNNRVRFLLVHGEQESDDQNRMIDNGQNDFYSFHIFEF